MTPLVPRIQEKVRSSTVLAVVVVKYILFRFIDRYMHLCKCRCGLYIYIYIYIYIVLYHRIVFGSFLSPMHIHSMLQTPSASMLVATWILFIDFKSPVYDILVYYLGVNAVGCFRIHAAIRRPRSCGVMVLSPIPSGSNVSDSEMSESFRC